MKFWFGQVGPKEENSAPYEHGFAGRNVHEPALHVKRAGCETKIPMDWNSAERFGVGWGGFLTKT